MFFNRFIYFSFDAPIPDAFVCKKLGEKVPYVDKAKFVELRKQLNSSNDLAEGNVKDMLGRLEDAVARDFRIDRSNDGKNSQCVPSETKNTSYLRDNVDVLFLQTLLKKVGYAPKDGRLDGVLGNFTIAAIKKFQKDNNLSPIDGNFGPETFRVLKEKVESGVAPMPVPVVAPKPAPATVTAPVVAPVPTPAVVSAAAVAPVAKPVVTPAPTSGPDAYDYFINEKPAEESTYEDADGKVAEVSAEVPAVIPDSVPDSGPDEDIDVTDREDFEDDDNVAPKVAPRVVPEKKSEHEMLEAGAKEALSRPNLGSGVKFVLMDEVEYSDKYLKGISEIYSWKNLEEAFNSLDTNQKVPFFNGELNIAVAEKGSIWGVKDGYKNANGKKYVAIDCNGGVRELIKVLTEGANEYLKEQKNNSSSVRGVPSPMVKPF